ncbi:hypothetical protein PR003_g22767 [Phytophthora rubi]|uniref:Uncharacterized protein n=1 Tax=Phytophthora rubi TaxID=129364 RepID=A0A6A4D1M3_9STRA|nr:hypothetical protein PR001_g23849 [Phytophthora rubi]KAE9300366.1 hypothetical protein PR003_g22767 [Phytophthora rubi]
MIRSLKCIMFFGTAFPGPDCTACANTGRANPHQHLQIVQIGCEVYNFCFHLLLID